jgi:hypothetical protein
MREIDKEVFLKNGLGLNPIILSSLWFHFFRNKLECLLQKDASTLV